MNVKRLVVLLICMIFIAAGLVACSRARSDAEITSDVQAKIHADAALAAAPITIQSNSGVVVLSGSVDTDAARSSAESTAQQVEGVKGVVNNLQVMTAAAPLSPGEEDGGKRISKPKAGVMNTAKAVPGSSGLPGSQQSQAAGSHNPNLMSPSA